MVGIAILMMKVNKITAQTLEDFKPKVSVFIATSLDGFIAGDNDELDWLDTVAIAGEDYVIPNSLQILMFW